MKVTVKYFAALREAIGVDQEEVHTLVKCIAELRQELLARGEPYQSALAQGRAIRCACNLELVSLEANIQDGDEIAFFPPVTGG
jgi:molybdopterin synthase sulfur carrier subunit